ncbi:flavodoxin family protein [Thermococcus sp.]|uniref:flavodoxin family protein n=1 Tax=Thermococcus sp. TaxID=35749 RepID=UPI0025FC15BA|nr:flavodoxin family protein [Thermococcus sp.]
MRALITYVSIHHGNTERIAKTIAEVLGAEMIKPWKVKPKELLEYDLIGSGSGIYWWRHHRSLFKLGENIPPVSAKKAFLFSTAGLNISWYTHRRLKRELQEKGFEIVGEFSCRGRDTNGPLARRGGLNRGHSNEKDLERAGEFAEKIQKALEDSGPSYSRPH